MKPKRLERRIIYQSDWLDLYLDKVQMPNGFLVEQHHLLELKRQVAACLAVNADGKIALCRISRYATGNTTWELPAGRIEAGETIPQAAEREVLEETGCQVKGLQPLYSYHPMDGISGQVFHILHAKVIECGEIIDKNEVSQVGWFDREEIRCMISEKQITCGLTLIGLLLWLDLNPE
jgi:8-oxo-dGTP pyrophosphatase MutT (NUDIX family)